MRGLIGGLAFAGLLVLSSLAAESDRNDAVDYQSVRAEIYASASDWAVRE